MGAESAEKGSWDPAGEIEAIRGSLAAVLEREDPALPGEVEVWRIYVRAETAVAKLKYRLESERPGTFSTLPSTESPRELLAGALARLDGSGTMAREGRLGTALELLRSARTSLRAYLAQLEKVRRRERRLARKAALSRRTSSPSS